MKNVKRTFLLLLLLLTSIALYGCSGGMKEGDNNKTPTDDITSGPGETEDDNQTASKEPVYGGSIIVGIPQDLDSLDPHKAVAAGTKAV